MSSCRLRIGSEIKIREWADMEREFPRGRGGALAVASDPRGDQSDVLFREEMKRLCGQIFTVKEISYNPVYGTYLIRVIENTDGWTIWEPMIESKPSMSAHCAADLEALFS